MNNAEFESLMGALKKHLKEDKVFIKNPARLADIERATEIAREIFKEMKVFIKDDPIQMGALILCIEGMDIVVRGEREIKLFQELVSKANNFEIYPVGDENVRFSILFNNALMRMPQGK